MLLLVCSQQHPCTGLRCQPRGTWKQGCGLRPHCGSVHLILRGHGVLTTSPRPPAGDGRCSFPTAPCLPQRFLQTEHWPDSTSQPFPWQLRSCPQRPDTHPAGWPAGRREESGAGVRQVRGRCETGAGQMPLLPIFLRNGLPCKAQEKAPVQQTVHSCRHLSSVLCLPPASPSHPLSPQRQVEK